MKLSANLIFDNLPSELDAVFYGDADERLHLLRPEFFEPSRDRFLADHVYLIKAEELVQRPRLADGVLIILLGSSVYLSQYTGKCTVIQIRAAAHPMRVFNLLTKIYDRYDRWAEALQETVNTTADLREMIAASRTIFDNPIIVLNANFQYLAHSDFSNRQLTDGELNRWGSPDSVSLPLDTLNEFRGLHDMSTDVKGPLLLNLRDSSTLNVNLFENGEYAGCVCIDYLNRKHRQSDNVLAVYLAKMIQYALRRYSSAGNNDQSKLRQALQDMVDGYQVSLSQWRTINTSYLQQEHVCVKIKFNSQLVQVPVKYLCNAIEDEFRRSVAFEHDNSIVCFIEISEKQAEDQSYLTLLEKHLSPLLKSFDCAIGISDPFHDIYGARPYYLQSVAALENGQLFSPEKRFYAFQDYALRELLVNAIGNLPIEMYYSEGMRRLKEHDESSAVSYIETLRAYLDNNMSTTKTTAQLYINRSTFLERIARIKRELGSDLLDPDDRLRIQILLRAEDFHKEMAAEKKNSAAGSAAE